MAAVMERVLGGSERIDEREAGDRLTSLMEERKAPLFNFLLALTHNPDLALECTQDTFVKAYEHLRRGKSVNASWLYTVARNRAIDEVRRHGREGADMEKLDGVPGPEGNGKQARVRAALAELPPEDREILHLFIVDRFKTDEIASMLGVRPGAARMRISRARERCRLLYGELA